MASSSAASAAEGAAAQGWSVDEVQQWLLHRSGLEIGLAAELGAQLLAEEIDGEALLQYDRDDLKKDLGLPGGKVATLWKALATLRDTEGAVEADAGGEGVPPPPLGAAAAVAAAAAAPPPSERVPPPKQLAVLVAHLPELDEQCWGGVVGAAREGQPPDEALGDELAALLVGCGLVDEEVQRSVVQQCAFLLKQFSKASSIDAVRQRLVPLGFSDEHIATLAGERGEDDDEGDGGDGEEEDEDEDDDEDEEEEDSDDDDVDDDGFDDTWSTEMLTAVREPELKALLSTTAQHMLGFDLQPEDLESVEEACAVARVPLHHAAALTKVLSAAIIHATSTAKPTVQAAAGTEDQEASTTGDDDGAAPYPLGDGHAALIASAAKWYAKQLHKQAQLREDEATSETAEGQAAASSSIDVDNSRSTVGWPYGCIMAGWLTLVGHRSAEVKGENDQDEEFDFRDGDEDATTGAPDPEDDSVQERRQRRWFVLRRTCIEVFASARDAERGERESAEYSAVPIPFIALRPHAGRSTSRRNPSDSEFGFRLLDLQMVLGNPLPKNLGVDAGDSSTREQWVQCLEAQALGEAKQKLSAAAHVAAGAAAGLGGIAAGGGSMGLAAAVAAKEMAKEKAHSASEAALLLKEQREEERERVRAEELALARENDAKRRAALEESLLSEASTGEEYYIYMRHFFMSHRRTVAKEQRVADYRAGRLMDVMEIFGGLRADQWLTAWDKDLEEQAEEEDDPLAVLGDLFDHVDTEDGAEVEPDLFPEEETDSDADDTESSGEDEESSEEESESSEEEDEVDVLDLEQTTVRQKEDSAHVQFGGKGRFAAVTMRLEGDILRLVQHQDGPGTGPVVKDWSLKITACSVRAPKKVRSAKGKNGAPTEHQLRLDLASGVQDDSGNSKYVICISSAADAEEWKRALEPAHTLDYRLFTVEQHHLKHKTAPKMVSLGVNRAGMALIDPATDRIYDRYRFAKVRGWKSDKEKLYLRVDVDKEYHSLGHPSEPHKPISFWLGTSRGAEVCDLLRSIAFAIDATLKRERWRSDAIAKGQPNKIEVGRCQYGGKGNFEPVTMELAGDRLVMETHLGAVTRLTVAKRIGSTAHFSSPKKVGFHTVLRHGVPCGSDSFFRFYAAVCSACCCSPCFCLLYVPAAVLLR